MKTLFISAKSKIKLDLDRLSSEIQKLPKNIAICYSIQFKDLAFTIKKILSKTHTINSITQVLGCSKPKFPKNTQVVLLIGEGRFHAISLALCSNLPIYILENNKIDLIRNSEVDTLRNRKKAAILKFLNSDKVGLLISNKPGQNRLEQTFKLKDKYKNKKFYFFLSDNINKNEFENFGINCFINTACPRLDMDNNFVNIDEI